MSRIKWTDMKNPSLSAAVLDVVSSFGFEQMTPVQAATIPRFLALKDVSAEAVTGSGKTLAFLVPLVEMLFRRHKDIPWQPRDIPALIISPTRELAEQISEVLSHFLTHEQFQFVKHLLMVGGNSIESDIKDLMTDGPYVLVCTPGRLDDLFQRKGALNLQARVKNLEVLILDEADRLLDLGFKAAISNILQYLPRQRRTGLFSATQTTEVIDLMRAGMRNPVIVSVKEKASISTPVRLQNFYQMVEPEEKFVALLNFLKTPDLSQGKIMVFFPTCACVEYWSEVLPQMLKQKQILGIHGKMPLKKRRSIVEKFRKVPQAILLSTDVLARGLDVPEIDWVIQWDPPSSAKSFVHRVGRTARQGNTGNALVFLMPSEDAYINFLQINQKVELNELNLFESSKEKANFPEVLKGLHHMQKSDKSIYDKGVRAFVSHIRAYSKHECSAILRMKDLELGKVATSYGLLQMPRMPELQQQQKQQNATTDFIAPDFPVDISKLKYKNKQKEIARLDKLQEYEKSGIWPGKKATKKRTESWADTKKAKLDIKTKKELRKAKKQKKREALIADNNNAGKLRKRKQQISQEDLDELANDIRLFKQLKRKKISEEDYVAAMGIEEEENV